MAYTQEEVLDKYEHLPQELKDAIFAEANADKVFDIGKRHNLTINKVGGLATQIGYVMLGLTRPKDFVDQLASALEVDKKSAQAIADDINREIFYPVREHLRNLHNAPNEFPEPKLDTPASIFAEKMVSVGREPVKEVYVIAKDVGKSRPRGEERLPGEKTSDVRLDVKRPSPRPVIKDSFAELRAELQREIEEERSAIEARSMNQEARVAPLAPTTPARQAPQKIDPVPAYLSEQRPSKAFALDEKESPTPTSPPASVGAVAHSSKPPIPPVSPGPQPIPPRTQTSPAPSPNAPASNIKNDGLLPAFRGYRLGSQNQSPTTRLERPVDVPTPPYQGGDKGEVTLIKNAAIPPLPKSQSVPTPIPKPPQNPAQQSHNSGPDPYREPAE